MSFVYLIESQNYFKIGIAGDVESRLAQLQTGNPVELVINACYEFPNAQVVEGALHQAFQGVRMNGEWFALSESHIQTFNMLCRLLGGKAYFPKSKVSNGDDLEDADQSLESANEGAKWDFSAMFADGWRMERSTSKGVNNRYWCWRKGSENIGRKYIYGGLISDLPYQIEEMRSRYGS